jgi:hypothetical protein
MMVRQLMGDQHGSRRGGQVAAHPDGVGVAVQHGVRTGEQGVAGRAKVQAQARVGEGGGDDRVGVRRVRRPCTKQSVA